MKKLKNALISLSMLAMPMSAFASAADEEYKKGWTKGLQDSGMTGLIDLMMKAFVFIGAAVVVFGAVQIAFAFRSDDAEGKTKGMRNAIAGVLVVAVGAVGGAVMGTLMTP